MADSSANINLIPSFSFFTIFQVLEILVAFSVYKACRRGGRDVGDTDVVQEGRPRCGQH